MKRWLLLSTLTVLFCAQANKDKRGHRRSKSDSSIVCKDPKKAAVDQGNNLNDKKKPHFWDQEDHSLCCAVCFLMGLMVG